VNVLGIDIETYCELDLLKVGAYRYVNHPSFEVLMIAYAYNDEPVKLWDITSDESDPDDLYYGLMDETQIKTAFNANFERTCLTKHFKAVMPPEEWRCTMVHALELGLPASLANVGSALKLPEDKAKSSTGKALINFFCKPCKPTKANGHRTRNLPHHDPERWELFKAYCKQDVEAERHIRKLLEKFPLAESEQELWCLDQRINDNGVLIDQEIVKQAIDIDTEYTQRLSDEAIELTGLANPNSVKQLKEWLEEQTGLDMEGTSLNKETVAKMQKDINSEDVTRLLTIRAEMAKTSTSKYYAMREVVCDDNRARGLLQFYGASRTGRWCIAEGSLVRVRTLCGAVKDKPIEDVLTTDQVWDGVDWVSHDGVIYQGDKDVITWDGLTATADHKVWVDKNKKIEFGKAKELGLKLWSGD
jgi:DNA polymerase